MSTTHTSRPLALVAVMFIALAGCGDKGGAGGSTVEGAESPQALVQRAHTLAEADDFGGIVRLMAPDERPIMSFGMIMFAKMVPAFMGGFGGLAGEEGKKEMEAKMAEFEKAMNAVLEKHGLGDLEEEQPPAEAMGDPMDAVKWLEEKAPELDHAAFVGDIIQTFGSLGEETAGKATNKFKELGGELKNLKVDGDKATGTIGDEEMDFKRIDGRWYFSIASKMGGPR